MASLWDSITVLRTAATIRSLAVDLVVGVTAASSGPVDLRPPEFQIHSSHAFRTDIDVLQSDSFLGLKREEAVYDC